MLTFFIIFKTYFNVIPNEYEESNKKSRFPANARNDKIYLIPILEGSYETQ